MDNNCDLTEDVTYVYVYIGTPPDKSVYPTISVHADQLSVWGAAISDLRTYYPETRLTGNRETDYARLWQAWFSDPAPPFKYDICLRRLIATEE